MLDTARGRLGLTLALGCAVVLGACGQSAHSTSSPVTIPPPHSKTLSIVPTPAGTIAFTQPGALGQSWVLAGTGLVKTVTRMDVHSGLLLQRLAVGAGAEGVALSTGGTLAVAIGTGSAGALDLYDTATGRPEVAVTLSGPALRVVTSAGGGSFYVLDQVGTARTVVHVSGSGTLEGAPVPVSPRLVDVAAFSDQSALWGLLSDGTIEEIQLPGGRVTTSFPTGQAASTLAVSQDGNTAFVLRSAVAAPNAASVSLATQSVGTVYPAPAHSVDMVLATDAQALYFAASTAAFGNIQMLELHA